jgi:hypothetical protein
MAPCVSAEAYWVGAVLAGVPAVLCGVSGISGAKSASRCGKIKRENSACIGGDDAACQRLRSGRLDP